MHSSEDASFEKFSLARGGPAHQFSEIEYKSAFSVY
jgi:hypothetical protein